MTAGGDFFHHVPTLVSLQYFPLAIVGLYVTAFEEDLIVKYNMLIMLCNTDVLYSWAQVMKRHFITFSTGVFSTESNN